jgi:hypothetical protein
VHARLERARFACYARCPSSSRVSIPASPATRLRSRAHQRWTIAIAFARAGVDARCLTRARVPSHDESIVANTFRGFGCTGFWGYDWRRVPLSERRQLPDALGDAAIDEDESRARRMTRWIATTRKTTRREASWPETIDWRRDGWQSLFRCPGCRRATLEVRKRVVFDEGRAI